jgi:hypothetical protein
VCLFAQSVGTCHHADDGRQRGGHDVSLGDGQGPVGAVLSSPPWTMQYTNRALLASIHGRHCWGPWCSTPIFIARVQLSRSLVAPRYNSHFLHSCARHVYVFFIFLDFSLVDDHDPSSLLRGSDDGDPHQSTAAGRIHCMDGSLSTIRMNESMVWPLARFCPWPPHAAACRRRGGRLGMWGTRPTRSGILFPLPSSPCSFLSCSANIPIPLV